LGFSSDRTTARGQKIHLSLTPNPSHLEAVDPVVEGRTRAKQDQFNDRERTLGVPLLIHGDAAFAGQGLVAETLNLSQLAGFRTGGTVHLVVNNQIGFTTAPSDARSTTYCTDVAKMIQVPIFHVNGEDPEAAVYVAELALDFRQTFGRDVVIDMYCYRRHGHNEGDEPSFTQPLMYAKIKDRPTLSEVYTEQLILRGDLTVDEDEAIVKEFQDKLHEAQEQVKSGPPQAVRLSGQDSRRGTFSQRHSVLYDAKTGEPYSPLNYLEPEQARFNAYDSLLSEAAVLGFDFGYSLDAPDTLVLWEAQFGDFANGAQVIIDQFICCSLSKWQRDSGLVMLLPHGYEGQGPEHSSARLERYLQLCAEDNLQVCYPSTPAQYFHLLRRQMKRNFRKPLIVLTPKSMLRSKAAV